MLNVCHISVMPSVNMSRDLRPMEGFIDKKISAGRKAWYRRIYVE